MIWFNRCLTNQIYMKFTIGARFLLLTLTAFFWSNTNAQNILKNIEKKDSSSDKKSFFKVNANYLSNAIYSGRKDSSVVPYLRPSIGYFDNSGFYINGGASLLVSPTDTKRIDLITLETGYAFNISKKLEGEITAAKFFYTDQSYAVTSELKAITGINLGYDLGVVAISAGADLLFSNNTDIFTNLKISHYFEMGQDTKKWAISPAIEMNAGTQYYNQAYYQNRKFTFATTTAGSGIVTSAATHGKGHANGSSSSGNGNSVIKTLVFNDKNKFNILDYEISVPVIYETSHWSLYATPDFAIPVNAANYAVNGVLQKEQLSNSFFIEIGAFIKLYTHRKAHA